MLVRPTRRARIHKLMDEGRRKTKTSEDLNTRKGDGREEKGGDEDLILARVELKRRVPGAVARASPGNTTLHWDVINFR